VYYNESVHIGVHGSRSAVQFSPVRFVVLRTRFKLSFTHIFFSVIIFSFHFPPSRFFLPSTLRSRSPLFGLFSLFSVDTSVRISFRR